jgi:hypothetical protein
MHACVYFFSLLFLALVGHPDTQKQQHLMVMVTDRRPMAREFLPSTYIFVKQIVLLFTPLEDFLVI